MLFQVDIRFPQSGAADPNCVTVTGLPDNVEEAIDHILNLEEEYVSVELNTWTFSVTLEKHHICKTVSSVHLYGHPQGNCYCL